MQGSIVQLNFRAAFDRVSHSGLFFIFGSMLPICIEFLSNRRQRFVTDGATSERIQTVYGVPQGSVLGSLLFIQYTSKMFQLVQNRLYAYANDYT